MNNESWDAVREFYITNFGVTSELVDLVASSDILLMCVSGASNKSISNSLGVDMDSVVGILDLVLDFDGFDEDLDFNPYSVYVNMINMGYDDFITFKEELKHIDRSIYESVLLGHIYRICKRYRSVEDRIDKEWN